MIGPFDASESMLVVGEAHRLLQLSADSLQNMADAMTFEQVHNGGITSLVFSKDVKYYQFTLIMHLCINYDLYVII